MYTGKHSSHSAPHRSKKSFTLLVAIVLCVTLAVGGSIAFLTSETNPVINLFSPANVSCYVDEQFDGTTKTGVRIQNTGNIDAYIRAVVVVNWVDSDGKICAGHAGTLPEISSSWTCGNDGFYYYTQPVAPGGYTGNLFDSTSLTAAQDGCKMQVEVVASAIQSVPESAVKDAWGFVPSGSN